MRPIILTALLSLLGARGFADTTINAAHHYAYGANIGWIELRGDAIHGAALGQSFLTGYVWSANCGWIGLGNGPTNGWRYSNLSSNDWGVNHDGLGNLSGYAYGANIGWINFEQVFGQPRVDLKSGNLAGYVWGANVGWIGFSNAQAYAQTDRLDAGPDTDHDGIPDPWEYKMAGNLTTLWGEGHDDDGDHASDVNEYGADTHPLDDESVLQLTAFERVADAVRLTWTVQPSRFYGVECATNIMSSTSWMDSGLGVLEPAGASTLTRDVADVQAPVRFYRPLAIIPLDN